LRGLEEKGHWGSGIFRRFFRWYAPYFEAYSYPLRRAHEFEADEAAAKAAGAKPAATSLLAGAVAARYLDADYWPTVYRRADDEREPPTAFAPMREHLARATKHESAATWLEQELTREPEPHDTHPTTAERIRHLGLDPKEVVEAARGNGSPAQTAAQAFLGPAEAALTEDIDRAWRQAIGGAWSERHQEAQRMKARLEELDGRAQQGELSLDDARERAGLTAEFRGAEQALPLYRDVLAREPNDAPAQFAVGQILLEQGEDDGLAHLDRAMEIDADALFPACEAAFLYLKSRGRDEEAERYRARAERRYDTLGLAQEERARPSARGPWDRHVLSAEEVEHLRAALARVPTVKRAFLVRKRTQHLDDELPLHALFIFPGGFTWDRQKFLDEVSAELPFDGWMFSPSLFSFKRWQLGRIPGAKIYGP
jgi:Peptidase family M48